MAARLADALEKVRIDLGADDDDDDDDVTRGDGDGKAEKAAVGRRIAVLERPQRVATRRRSCARVAMAACART